MRLAVTVPFLVVCQATLRDASQKISILPLLFFVVAALTDFFDGRVARREGTGAGRGQLFDHATDVVFIGSGLVFFAATERLSWWVPVAVATSVAAYAHVLWRDARATGNTQTARSAVGHAAGVVNYALVGLLTADLALPRAVPGCLLPAAAGATAGINLLAVVGRLWPRRSPVVASR